MTEHVKVEDANGVRTITMARPEKKNALTHAMYAVMADAIVSAQSDASVRVVLLTGEGGVFSAGNDLTDFMQSPPSMEDGSESSVQRFLMAILTAEKPLAAAVAGVAVGIGTTMLLHCDLVYAAPSAKFKTPFADLGLVPEAASSLLLPARIGRARAAEMFLLGEVFGAEEALECGLVARIFPEESLIAETLVRCEALARKAPTAVRATKRLMRGDIDALKTRMADEGALFAERLKSDEFSEAVGAFFEKRQPDFSRFT